MANTNELGFGSLASVAWTDMNGTGLTTAQLADVNADIIAATTVATALIDSIKGMVKTGKTSFSLSDLNPAYFGLPDVGSAGNNAISWASFISEVTGDDISATKDLSLNDWRRVAAELQDYASQQASRRNPSGAGGGVKTVNGHWYVNGQQLSLLDAYMAIRVNQVANFDDSLNIYIAELNNNNRLVKGANDWLATLRNKKPQATTGGGGVAAAERQSFSARWGYDPVAVFQPKDVGTTGVGDYFNAGDPAYKKFDTWIETVKGYVDAKDTSNQTVQQKLEQMTNRRSEVLDGLTSFAKSQTQTGSSFARNLG